MLEIISEMVFCLVLALLMGFIIGYMFAKSLQKKRKNTIFDDESKDLKPIMLNDEKIKKIQDLEKKYNREKEALKECRNKVRNLKGELLKKASLLEETSNTLQDVQKRQCKEFEEEIKRLKETLKEKEAELREFETVLIKAEKTIEALKRGD